MTANPETATPDLDALVERLENLATRTDKSQHAKWCCDPHVPVHGYSAEGSHIREAASAIRSLKARAEAAESRAKSLLDAGCQLANVAYNIDQRGYADAGSIRSLKCAQLAWDDPARALKKEAENG